MTEFMDRARVEAEQTIDHMGEGVWTDGVRYGIYVGVASAAEQEPTDAGKAEAQKVIADTTAPAPQPAPPTVAPNCSSCQRSRTADDDLDYNPTQVMFGGELGWYSGDDGEMCGDCMTGLIRGQQ